MKSIKEALESFNSYIEYLFSQEYEPGNNSKYYQEIIYEMKGLNMALVNNDKDEIIHKCEKIAMRSMQISAKQRDDK